MLITVWSKNEASAFIAFFLIIPQMWLTHTESPFRTTLSIALISFVIVLLVHYFQLSSYLMVYQFVVSVLAASSYFGLTVPLLKADNNRLQRQIFTDALTGVASRDFLLRQIKLESERSLRYKSDLTMIVFDIDCFKQINDEFGHLAGDEMLIRVSEAAQQTLRSTDILGRIGGDEFVILLPDTSISDATNTAHRILSEVRQLTNKNNLSMSISLGVAKYHRDDSFEQFFSRADKLLYLAKRSGRNQLRSCQLAP